MLLQALLAHLLNTNDNDNDKHIVKLFGNILIHAKSPNFFDIISGTLYKYLSILLPSENE